MKKITSNLRKGLFKLEVENLDDLWLLNQIIELNDLVKSKTFRKIKLSKEDERSTKITKRPVVLELSIERIEFQPYSDVLKLAGKITQAPDDIPKGSYHTFNIEPGSIFSITKSRWLKFQLDRLKEAIESKSAKILICIFDREDAFFAITKKSGYDVLAHIAGDVEKKDQKVIAKGSFYKDIIVQLQNYAKRYKVNNIILASPAFWKEELLKVLKDPEIKSKLILASCSSATEHSIIEVLKRPEVRQALKQERTSEEINLVEDLFTEISQDGKAAYGLSATESAVNMGAVLILLITDQFIKDMQEKKDYEKIDSLLRTTESLKGTVHIISSDHEGGKKLNGLGGIGAILRYNV